MVTSSRSGEAWRFQYATRPTTPGKTGKVLVNPAKYTDDGGTEVYASVFGLTVEAVTADDLVTRIVEAATEADALAVLAGVPPKALRPAAKWLATESELSPLPPQKSPAASQITSAGGSSIAFIRSMASRMLAEISPLAVNLISHGSTMILSPVPT